MKTLPVDTCVTVSQEVDEHGGHHEVCGHDECRPQRGQPLMDGEHHRNRKPEEICHTENFKNSVVFGALHLTSIP